MQSLYCCCYSCVRGKALETPDLFLSPSRIPYLDPGPSSSIDRLHTLWWALGNELQISGRKENKSGEWLA